MSAWHNSAMPQCVTGITNHIIDMDTVSNKLGTRLVTTMTVTIPHTTWLSSLLYLLLTPCALLISPHA